MWKHCPIEHRERAAKMVLDHLDEYRSPRRQGVRQWNSGGSRSLRGRIEISRRPTRFCRWPRIFFARELETLHPGGKY